MTDTEANAAASGQVGGQPHAAAAGRGGQPQAAATGEEHWSPPAGYRRLASAVEGIEVYRDEVNLLESIDDAAEDGEATEAAFGTRWFRMRPDVLEEMPHGWGVGLVERTCADCYLGYAHGKDGPEDCAVCGGILEASATTSRRVRPVLLGSGELPPGEAVARLRRYIRLSGRIAERHYQGVEFNVRRLLIPVWLFSADLEGEWSARVPHEETEWTTDSRGNRVSETHTVWRHEKGEVDGAAFAAIPGNRSLPKMWWALVQGPDWESAEPLGRGLEDGVVMVHDIERPSAWQGAHSRFRESALEQHVPYGAVDVSARVRYANEWWSLGIVSLYVGTASHEGRRYVVATSAHSGTVVGDRLESPTTTVSMAIVAVVAPLILMAIIVEPWAVVPLLAVFLVGVPIVLLLGVWFDPDE